MGPHVKVSYGCLTPTFERRFVRRTVFCLPLPLFLSSSPPLCSRFSLFPIIFHLSYSSKYNRWLSCSPGKCGATDLWSPSLLTAFISLEWSKSTRFPLWKIWGVGNDISCGPPAHCAVEMWLPVPALTRFLILFSLKESLILERFMKRIVCRRKNSAGYRGYSNTSLDWSEIICVWFLNIFRFTTRVCRGYLRLTEKVHLL